MLSGRFRVRFEDIDADIAKIFTSQTIQVSSYVLSRPSEEDEEDGIFDTFSIILEEDSGGLLAEAVYKLNQQDDTEFTVYIEYLDGNDRVNRTTKFENVFLSSAAFGELSYDPVAESETLNINTKNLENNSINTVISDLTKLKFDRVKYIEPTCIVDISLGFKSNSIIRNKK